MKIAIVNTKGGCGKTTTAIYLAQVAHTRGMEAQVWDADPQASATRWGTSDSGEPRLPFPVIPANMSSIKRPVDPETWVFIDTPPGNPATIAGSAAAADLVIIPTSSSVMDMDRTWETIDALHGAVPTAVLLTATEPQTKVHREIVDALKEEDVPVLHPIRKRQSFRTSFGQVPEQFWGYGEVLTELKEALQ